VVPTQTLSISEVEKVPMYEQQKFKYQIYADGHVAAMRYTSMMVLGSVILKVHVAGTSVHGSTAAAVTVL
jgi:hypothetical protein